MATVTVSDSTSITENIAVWTFQKNTNDAITVKDTVNAQIDLGFVKLYFNNDNLNDIPNLQINAIDLYDQAARNLDSFSLARSDGLKMVNATYGLKLVTVDGFIAASTRVLFETARDTLLLMVEPQEANLRFSQSGADRNYTATMSNIIWNETPGGGFGTFSLQFTCSDPFGYDTSNTTDVNSTTITTQTSNQTFTAIGGTFQALPVFTLTLNSGTGLTNASVTLIDHSGNQFSVTRTWVAGDILSIDCNTKAVTINGTAVDYSGVFPILKVLDTQVNYFDSFTTRNLTFKMVHKNRYK